MERPVTSACNILVFKTFKVTKLYIHTNVCMLFELYLC